VPDRGLFEYDRGLLEYDRGLLEYTVVAGGAGLFEYDRGLLEYDRGLLEYAVVAGGAGGGDVVVRPHEAQVHGQQGAAHVGDGKWYTEGVHLAV
jgi:hypothetical protein